MTPVTKHAPRIRGRYRLHEQVCYVALRYLYDNGPSTAWKCTYAARRNTLDEIMLSSLERDFIEVTQTQPIRLYGITDRGIKYMRALGKMLELLDNKD